MATKNIFKSVILSLLAVCNINATELNDTVYVVKHDTVQTAQQSLEIMSGQGSSRGCFHCWITPDGKFEMSNCNGFQFFAGAEMNISQATSELGTFNNAVVMARVGVEYEFWGFRPQVSFAAGQSMEIEGNKFSAKEFKFALNYDFFRHKWYSFSLGANCAYKLLKSTKYVDTNEFTLTLPYSGNAFSFGLQASKDIHLGHYGRKVSFSDGQYRYNYKKRGEFFLRLYGSWNPYTVDKLKSNEVESTLKLKKNFNVGVAFVVRPAW